MKINSFFFSLKKKKRIYQIKFSHSFISKLLLILKLKQIFLLQLAMRMSVIQTDEQLVYVVRCLVAYADACGLFNSKPELQEVLQFFFFFSF